MTIILMHALPPAILVYTTLRQSTLELFECKEGTLYACNFMHAKKEYSCHA